MKKFKPGDKIMIKVNGKEFETIIDDAGVQRFPRNRIIRYMLDNNGKTFNLNTLWSFVDNDMFSIDEARAVYRDIGSSVCAYCDVFDKDTVENPLWLKEEK